VLWAAATLVAGCGAMTAGTGGAAETEGDDQVDGLRVATAQVIRQDLAATDELAGWLGYEDPAPLIGGRGGVVTWMPAEGELIGRGEVLAEIDGAATRLLIGDRPMWRPLAVGQPDGPDIEQLNDNLAALGYAERDELPDDRFDWRTRATVNRWQADLGMPRTGTVELGDVVFLPSSAVRIGTVEAEPGTWVGAGEPLANVTGSGRVVTVDVDVRHLADVAEGAAVTMLWPDGNRTEAVVRSVGRVATTAGGAGGEGSGDDPTVTVEIDPGELTGGLDLDAAPVVVVIDRVLASDVLTVPVGALLANAGGGYAVERVGSAGVIELVSVDPGQFADGLVEITGELSEGDDVVVPA
jgi:hypothetical protein